MWAVCEGGRVYGWGRQTEGGGELGRGGGHVTLTSPALLPLPLSFRVRRVVCGPHCAAAVGGREGEGEREVWGWGSFYMDTPALTPARFLRVAEPYSILQVRVRKRAEKGVGERKTERIKYEWRGVR